MPRDRSLHFMWVYAGDGLHLSAVCLLIGWILHKRTCKGISGRTQIVTALVDFLQFAYAAGANTNIYPDSPDLYSLFYNAVASTLSAVLLYVMYGKYKKTIEKDYDTFWIEVFIILCGGVALVANPIYKEADDKSETDPLSVIYYTSVYLNSVSILPQIYFNFRTGSKTLCMSLYVLLSMLCTFFYVYFLVTEDKVDRLEEVPKYMIYPECAQLLSYVLFFVLLVAVPKYEKILPLPLSEVESTTGSSINGGKPDEPEKNDQPVIVVTRPQLDRQQSLLETPFLKKSLPSSASVNVIPDPQKPFHKLLRQQSRPSMTKIMKLTQLKRARTSASSLFILGAASAPSTPEDEGFMLFKETALQSRKRRLEYTRRRSLPITPTESSSGALDSMNNLSNDKVKFSIGDDDDSNHRIDTIKYRKHQKTPSFEKILAVQKLKSLQAKIDADNAKTALNLAGTKTREPQMPGNKADVGEPGSVETKNDPELKIKPESIPRKAPGPKVSDASRKRSRRATVYQQGPYSPQMPTWKTLATSFLGTGPPIGVRRPSVQGLPPEQAQIDRRRRNRIFSMV